MNTLFIVRHAECITNVTKEFSYKKYDYPLADKGIIQAQQTGEHFKNIQIDHIYTSPLKRAVDTAKAIAGTRDIEITILEDLRETNVGNLEGPPPSLEKWRIHNQIVDDWFNGDLESAPPGGEDYHTLLKRTRAALITALKNRKDANIVIVGHGGMFIFTMHDYCENVDMASSRSLVVNNCSITTLDAAYIDGDLRCKLIEWASTKHLSGTAADFIPGIVKNYDE